jgi:hypothetical protein
MGKLAVQAIIDGHPVRASNPRPTSVIHVTVQRKERGLVT